MEVEKNHKDLQKKITAIYLEILKREPGKQELQNHIEWMKKNNISIEQLPQLFKNSPEYLQKQYELTLDSSEKLLKHIGEFSFILNPNDKTQVQIFSEDGNLLTHHFTLPETWAELKIRDDKIKELKIKLKLLDRN